MTKVVTRRILKIQKIIRQKIEEQPSMNLIVGAEREKRVSRVLERLRSRKKIHGFIKTSSLDVSDLHGADFFVIMIGESNYQVFPIGVTGERWIEEDIRIHPDKIELAVNFSDSDERLAEKILELIKKFSEKHQN